MYNIENWKISHIIKGDTLIERWESKISNEKTEVLYKECPANYHHDLIYQGKRWIGEERYKECMQSDKERKELEKQIDRFMHE